MIAEKRQSVTISDFRISRCMFAEKYIEVGSNDGDSITINFDDRTSMENFVMLIVMAARDKFLRNASYGYGYTNDLIDYDSKKYLSFSDLEHARSLAQMATEPDPF